MPCPQEKLSAEFRDRIARQRGAVPMGKPLGVRLPLPLDEALRQMPDRQDWVRAVLLEAALKEGVIDREQARAALSTIKTA